MPHDIPEETGKAAAGTKSPKPGPQGARTRLAALAALAGAAALATCLGNGPDGLELATADRAMAQTGGAPADVRPAPPSGPAPAPQPPIVEGDDYKALAQAMTLTPDDPDRPLEFVYIFWYGCGTCRRLDPAMDQYVSFLPGDVRVSRIPAMYEGNALWMDHARLFYALDTLGREAALHSKIFEAVQDTGPPDASGHAAAGLANFEQMARFAAQNGISREEFERAWNSPETSARFQRGLAFINNIDVDSVPAVAVNGRYAYTVSRGGIPRFLDTAQKLLADERERLAVAKAD